MGEIMGALITALSGSPYGGLINNSGGNYANMRVGNPGDMINMPAPNTIFYPQRYFGEDFAASPQQGIASFVNQYNAAAAQLGQPPLSPQQIQQNLLQEAGQLSRLNGWFPPPLGTRPPAPTLGLH